MTSKTLGILLVIFSLFVGIYLGKNLENIADNAIITIDKIISKLKENYWIKSLFNFIYIMTIKVFIPMFIIALFWLFIGYGLNMLI